MIPMCYSKYLFNQYVELCTDHKHGHLISKRNCNKFGSFWFYGATNIVVKLCAVMWCRVSIFYAPQNCWSDDVMNILSILVYTALKL